jgi:hypothetical protein
MTTIVRGFIFAALCIASMDAALLGGVEIGSSAGRAIAAASALVACIVLATKLLAGMPANASIRQLVYEYGSALFFMVRLFPIYATSIDISQAADSTTGSLSSRLRRFVALDTVRAGGALVLLLSLYIYSEPGLPLVLNKLEGPISSTILRYVSLSILLTNVSLLVAIYMKGKDS